MAVRPKHKSNWYLAFCNENLYTQIHTLQCSFWAILNFFEPCLLFTAMIWKCSWASQLKVRHYLNWRLHLAREAHPPLLGRLQLSRLHPWLQTCWCHWCNSCPFDETHDHKCWQTPLKKYIIFWLLDILFLRPLLPESTLLNRTRKMSLLGWCS